MVSNILSFMAAGNKPIERDNYTAVFSQLEQKMEEAVELTETLSAVIEDPHFEYADIGAINKYCADDMSSQISKLADAVKSFAVDLQRKHGL